MGHLSPTGAARGAGRRVRTYSTTEHGWAPMAIDDLLDRRDVVVDDFYVQARSLNPRVAVWPQLRQRLAAHGIRTPVGVPDEPWSREEAVALLRRRIWR